MIQFTIWRRGASSRLPRGEKLWHSRHTGKTRLIPGLLCSAAIVLGLLDQSELRLLGSAEPGFVSSRPAAVRQAPAEQSPSRITMNVDATKHSPSDPAAFKALCAVLTAASGVRPEGLPAGAEAVANSDDSSAKYKSVPDWYLWAQLNSQCSSAAPAAAKTLQMYAVHSEAGGAVCLSNSSDQISSYLLKLRLPKGVFRIERLSFTPPLRAERANDSATEPVVAASIGHAQAQYLAYPSELRRLEGCDNGEASPIAKSGELAPGEVAIIRFTDVARAARVSYSDLKSELHNLAASTPGPAAKLRRIVIMGDSYLSGVTSGTNSSCPKRLGCVHRLILLMSQAESLLRNYQSRQSVNADPGARTMGALERIEDSLAETSAVMTGLVPQIELGPFTQPQPVGADAAGQGRLIETVATISVRNTGSRSVESVKLGLDASALPEGSVCIPDDPAFFGPLRPGQAVRAEFKLKLPDSEQTLPARFVADVSYFTSGAPAHLRPRPW